MDCTTDLQSVQHREQYDAVPLHSVPIPQPIVLVGRRQCATAAKLSAADRENRLTSGKGCGLDERLQLQLLLRSRTWSASL